MLTARETKSMTWRHVPPTLRQPCASATQGCKLPSFNDSGKHHEGHFGKALTCDVMQIRPYRKEVLFPMGLMLSLLQLNSLQNSIQSSFSDKDLRQLNKLHGCSMSTFKYPYLTTILNSFSNLPTPLKRCVPH